MSAENNFDTNGTPYITLLTPRCKNFLVPLLLPAVNPCFFHLYLKTPSCESHTYIDSFCMLVSLDKWLLFDTSRNYDQRPFKPLVCMHSEGYSTWSVCVSACLSVSSYSRTTGFEANMHNCTSLPRPICLLFVPLCIDSHIGMLSYM